MTPVEGQPCPDPKNSTDNTGVLARAHATTKSPLASQNCLGYTWRGVLCQRRNLATQQGREIHIPVPGPPKNFMGDKSPVRINLLIFPRKS